MYDGMLNKEERQRVLIALLISEIEQRNDLPLLPFGEGSMQRQKEEWGAELFMQTLWQTVPG